MADEWDDEESTGKTFVTTSNYADDNTENDDWNLGGTNDEENERFTRNGNSGGGRGGRGRGGFRGNRRDNHSNNEYEDDNREWGRREPRERNGRENGGDGEKRFGGGRRNRNEDEGENTEKPKEFYIPVEETEEELFQNAITSGINFNRYDSIAVNVTPGAPESKSRFEDMELRTFILDNIKRTGYSVPTPIQKHAIPIIMAKRDLMGCAQTGSGKTAAYLLPILNDLLENPETLSIGKPQALIISPTRELSIQIFNEARKFSSGSYLKISLVYGGTAVKHQGDNIAKGCHLLVATPGRLLDFVERTFITFENTRIIVLDEADRMLDMGFFPAVEKVMNHSTTKPTGERQTLMFSATFPDEIQTLAGQFLHNYLTVFVGIVGGACQDVDQEFYQVSKFEKRGKLMEILEESDDVEGIMVFVETKRNADFLASLLSETKFPTTSIHGDRLQREREMALRDFKTGKMSILIATSVAARGLDIKNVKHVINYDLPSSIDEYVHRIGRTGRVGNIGKATSFYDPERDASLAKDLVRILKQANKEVPEFLMSAGGNENFSSGSNRNSRFGGKDIRNRKNLEETGFGASITNEPIPLEPEEEW